jgi:hypothetical protein
MEGEEDDVTNSMGLRRSVLLTVEVSVMLVLSLGAGEAFGQDQIRPGENRCSGCYGYDSPYVTKVSPQTES